ncbi:MAG: hypothetical protein KJZ78_19890 [Bryobacteraceae bacterium]|nr:hypothetical protein [Bryobacteraceae bacterium]
MGGRDASLLEAEAALYIDEVAVAAGRELYKGGPYVAAFAGAMPAALEDSWVLTATNDGAGAIQTWYHRSFDMAGKGLLLPTTGAGAAIPDTVIG